MKYLLENSQEFDRLEKQSQTDLFDFKKELPHPPLPNGAAVLDAGCGSGIVTRYLGSQYPGARVFGCDQSEQRVAQARDEAAGSANLDFQVADLRKLPYETSFFDLIVCRFVLEHLPEDLARAAVTEMYRCLKPGGLICLIDIDGYFHNLYPQPPEVAEFLERLENFKAIDLQVGRKLPNMLQAAKFAQIKWRIETLEIRDDALATEATLIDERFKQTHQVIAGLLGSEPRATRFEKAYLDTLRSPGSVLFYNKFVATGRKPPLQLVSE